MKAVLTAALIDNDHTSLLSLKLKRGQFVPNERADKPISQVNWHRYRARLCLVIPSQFVHLNYSPNAALRQQQVSPLYQDSLALPGSGSLRVTGHEEAIERLTQQLPVTAQVLEPAAQAWVRYSNYILPSLLPYTESKRAITEWVILCKEQTLYILLRVEHGVLVSLHSLSRIDAIRLEPLPAMILSYLSSSEDSLAKACLAQFNGVWVNINSTNQSEHSSCSLLFGAALRGFFPWHG